MVQVLHSSKPRARVAHICDNCGRTIEPGETYSRQDNVYDVQRYTWKSCTHCSAAFHALWDRYGDWDEGLDLAEAFRDACTESLSDARAWVYFTRKWRRRDGTLVDPQYVFPTPKDGK